MNLEEAIKKAKMIKDEYKRGNVFSFASEVTHNLNMIEKQFPQDLFIKTHLCTCGKLEIEIWIKQ